MNADLVVAGGGPAGLAAAIAARMNGMSVVLFEPRLDPVEKACGEGLMPAGIEALHGLGSGVPRGMPFVGIRYEDAADSGRAAEGRFSAGPGLGVRRRDLSAALYERARSLGVVVRREAIRDLTPGADHVEVCGLRAPYLVAADGLRSSLRRRLDLELPPRRLARFGVVRHYRVEPWSDHVVVILGAGAEAYVTPVAADEIGVAILHGPPARFDALLGRFPSLSRRLDCAARVGRDRGAGPFEQRVRRRVSGRVLLVGDAAGYLDPLTGEGVSLGLRTGRAAVECIARGAPDAYEARYRTITRRYYGFTAALLAAIAMPMFHRPLIGAAALAPGLFGALLDAMDGSGAAGRGRHRRGRVERGRSRLEVEIGT